MLSACSPVAGTGRNQLNFYNDDSINRQAAAFYSEIITPDNLSHNRAQTAMIKRVGARIARAAEIYMQEFGRQNEIANFRWEFNLLDGEEANAFCLPGGKVAFYSGIMEYCLNDAGVATVMGHEVAHALARHGAERASQVQMANIGGNILGIFLGGSGVSSGAANAIFQIYGIGTQVGVLLPYSRTHESEADRIGLSLMAIAGYDPQEAITFWERLRESPDKEDPPPVFLSSHPSDQTRMDTLRLYLDEARARARAAQALQSTTPLN